MVYNVARALKNGCHVDSGGHHKTACVALGRETSRETLWIVHPVLHAQNHRVRPQIRCHLRRDGLRIVGLHTQQNAPGPRYRREVCGGLQSHPMLRAISHRDTQAVLHDGFDMCGTANQRDRMPCPRQESTKKTTHGARPDHRYGQGRRRVLYSKRIFHRCN